MKTFSRSAFASSDGVQRDRRGLLMASPRVAGGAVGAALVRGLHLGVLTGRARAPLSGVVGEQLGGAAAEGGAAVRGLHNAAAVVESTTFAHRVQLPCSPTGSCSAHR